MDIVGQSVHIVDVYSSEKLLTKICDVELNLVMFCNAGKAIVT